MNLPAIKKIILLCLLTVWLSGIALAQEAQDPWVQQVEGRQFFAVMVEDMDRAVDWYVETFGMSSDAESEAEDGSWKIKNLRNSFLHVELIYVAQASEADRPLGLFKVGFSVPNVEIVADKIEKVTGLRPDIFNFDPLSLRVLQFRDPEGNIIQLSSPLKK